MNVVYDKESMRVLLYVVDHQWVMPSCWELAHYDEGSEPLFEEDEKGNLYLVPNTVIVSDL